VICQELLDALPIHVFEFTKRGWREKLIDLDELNRGLKVVLSKGVTVAARGLLRDWVEEHESGKKGSR